MSFKSYSELFLKISQNNYKVSTHYKVNGIIKNRLSYFFEYDISEIKPSIIKNWISNINDVSIKSKKHYLGILSQIFDLALDDEIILKNPTKNIKLPKHQKKRIKPFSKDEVLKIIDFSKKYNDKFQIFLKLGFFTGMRTGEILALKINDIDFKAKTININSTRSRFGESTPKTFYSIRKIPLFNVIYSDLYEYVHKYKNNTYLLETQYSDPYKDDYVFSRNYWKIILKDLNLEYRRLYSMRHTFATNALLSKSLSPIELSKILGHSNCEMVYKVYVSYINNLEKNIDFDINIY